MILTDYNSVPDSALKPVFCDPSQTVVGAGDQLYRPPAASSGPRGRLYHRAPHSSGRYRYGTSNQDPDPTFHIISDPDPACQIISNPYPACQIMLGP